MAKKKAPKKLYVAIYLDNGEVLAFNTKTEREDCCGPEDKEVFFATYTLEKVEE